MDIGLLGALNVRENGVSIAPTAPKPRQVLALLALRAGQVVPVSTLIEELWAGAPPRSARTTLQTYVLQLRELIATALRRSAGPDAADAPSAKDVLTTLPGGYLLATGGGRSDIQEFERLRELGCRAMDDENFADASRALRQALDLWTGPPFADVHTGAHLAMEARRLEESRLCALDQRIEADLRLGRHRELLAELTVLTSRYRTHENLHAQFMLALYRSGRRGEALHVYQQLRTLLVRDLGLEPSARLRRLQQSVLTATAENPDSPERHDDLAVPTPGGGLARVP
ncbi:AfsR/SARP family transcriptional regulator [Streptomyces sp. NPDC002763]|uniref:AfsR/SARP family transcriptional regulator n=1 Tax=Streptomyces sp. NPDC002763 TaxID=3154427 RepID=UPI003317BDFC